jgi:hypothetical protein
MTQTITKKSGTNTVDLYSVNGNQKRYCATVSCHKISFKDLAERDIDFNDLSHDEIKALETFAKSNGKPIWHATGEYGKNHYNRFFCSKKDALADMLAQDC